VVDACRVSFCFYFCTILPLLNYIITSTNSVSCNGIRIYKEVTKGIVYIAHETCVCATVVFRIAIISNSIVVCVGKMQIMRQVWGGAVIKGTRTINIYPVPNILYSKIYIRLYQ